TKLNDNDPDYLKHVIVGQLHGLLRAWPKFVHNKLVLAECFEAFPFEDENLMLDRIGALGDNLAEICGSKMPGYEYVTRVKQTCLSKLLIVDHRAEIMIKVSFVRTRLTWQAYPRSDNGKRFPIQNLQFGLVTSQNIKELMAKLATDIGQSWD